MLGIALWGMVLKDAGKQGQLASHTHEKDMTTVRSQMGIFSQTTDPLVQNEIWRVRNRNKLNIQ